MAMIQPGILLRQQAGTVTIEQNRPSVTGLLRGLNVTDSLARIPTLLPVCGNAQQIAARRACIEAGADLESETSAEASTLWQEQLLAAAWRLTVDWPELVGESRDLESLRRVRGLSGKEQALAVLELLPGLAAANTTQALADWVEAGNCLAARVVAAARGVDGSLAESAPDNRLLNGDSLYREAEHALSVQPFDHLAPDVERIEVGAMAMARHSLIGQLIEGQEFGVTSRRLMAQLLDTLALIDGADTAELADASVAWPSDNGIGLGVATTARGPVIHRVSLDEKDTVRDWRVLAPTDWHFAPEGPLVALAAKLDAEALPFLVAAFDPCAPWSLVEQEIGHA